MVMGIKQLKNIQVIDGADNCAYDIYTISEESFLKIFPNGQDIEFIEDLIERLGEDQAQNILEPVWKNRVPKSEAQGVHGTLFYGLLKKKQYYPNKKDSDLDLIAARPIG